MWWVAPLAGAAIGAYMGHQQQKAQNQARKDQALINMYAPLFGQAPSALPAQQDQVTPAALQGAMSGYSLASQAEMQGKLGELYDKEIARRSTAMNSSQPEIVIPYAQAANQSVGAPAYNLYDPRYNPMSILGG